MPDLPLDIDSANRRLQQIFAPFVLGLKPTVEQFDADGVTLRMPYDDSLCRVGGIICGQALMTLIDTCMVFVCYQGLGRIAEVTTVSQNTSFMRPAINDDVIARGRVIKAGRMLVFGEVTLTMAGDERPVCVGTSTYAVLPDR